ncbi:hypothetical protein FKM82_026102 [Ascaphus truei]
MEKIELPEEYPRKELEIVQGIPMVQACVDNWEKVDVFQVRSDDHFIASYPKSGPSTPGSLYPFVKQFLLCLLYVL